MVDTPAATQPDKPYLDRGGRLRSVRTDEGFLRADALLTRAGVFEYLNPDGSTRREYRPPDEVFDPASLSTATLLPVTDDHPETPDGLLSPDNVKQFQIGASGENVKHDGLWVSSTVAVHDRTALDKIDFGKVEISMGYRADYFATPGVTPDGEPYDGVQKNIRYNHVALVDKGRAQGSRIFLDAAQQLEKSPVEKVQINGVTFEVAPQVAEALSAERATHDAKAARVDGLQSEVEKVKARADGLADENAKLKAKLEDRSAVQAQVRERIALERQAGRVLGEAKLDDASDRDVRLQVLDKLTPGTADKCKDKSDDYVCARFDQAMESFDPEDLEAEDLKEEIRNTRTDAQSTRVDAAAARQKMIERNRKVAN